MPLDKHINFFELEKASARPGCPLCTIVSDRCERYLDNMLFEHISDRAFRKAHRAAGGFCAFHSRNLESFRDGLAVAILGRDILEDRVESFTKRKILKTKERCPVCVEQDRIEQEYLGFLIKAEPAADDVARQLQDIVVKSSGLCAPHYGQLLETAKKIPRWILEFHEKKFASLLERTNRFIECSAYGREKDFAELNPADQVVWKELAANLRGS
ncbi:hypothetical protein FACS1894172_21050 [Spirochaetia bacterium]|nr:hypothetical protein FACS1894164_02990 [Spirochaetia bacterium]GHU37571.1 hypothetical protein FACS1894172_21050 [Spirochaetia bacterium]